MPGTAMGERITRGTATPGRPVDVNGRVRELAGHGIRGKWDSFLTIGLHQMGWVTYRAERHNGPP